MTRLAAALDAAGGDEALATEDLDAIQAAIDSWETVLAAYWATTANNEVVTLQSHVSTILATLESTFASFQDDMDDPSELRDFLTEGMWQLRGSFLGAGTAVLNFDRDLIDAYAGLVVDSVARAKKNCDSGTIFAGSDDTTCTVFDDMLDDLAIVDNLLGVCDFVDVDIPSHVEFCQTRDADDLPSWTLDTLGVMNRYITFGSGAETEISYTIEQGSGMSQDVDLTTDADGTIAADFTTEFTIFGAKVHAGLGLDQSASVTVNIGRGAERSHDRDHSVTITLADDDPGDVFVVKIEADPTFGTPVFTTAGGESVCPGETSTSRRAESITIFDVLDQCTSDYGSGLSAQGGGSTACDATNLVYGDVAYFSVIVQNEVDLESVTAEWELPLDFALVSPAVAWNAGKDYYADDDEYGPCGADGASLGLKVSMVKDGAVGGTLGKLEKGLAVGQWEFLIAVEATTPGCLEYNNVELRLSPSCEYGMRSITQYQEELVDGAVVVVNPVWRNATYCDGSDDDDCENNAWDEDTEPRAGWASTFAFDVSWAAPDRRRLAAAPAPPAAAAPAAAPPPPPDARPLLALAAATVLAALAGGFVALKSHLDAALASQQAALNRQLELIKAQLESARMSHKADVQGVVQQLKA